jgi:hypothetical protein
VIITQWTVISINLPFGQLRTFSGQELSPMQSYPDGHMYDISEDMLKSSLIPMVRINMTMNYCLLELRSIKYIKMINLTQSRLKLFLHHQKITIHLEGIFSKEDREHRNIYNTKLLNCYWKPDISCKNLSLLPYCNYLTL